MFILFAALELKPLLLRHFRFADKAQ
jgi:hypothetical protein